MRGSAHHITFLRRIARSAACATAYFRRGFRDTRCHPRGSASFFYHGPGTRSPRMWRTPLATVVRPSPRWTAHWGAWRRPEAGAPSTRPGARHKARRDPGPVREDPARVARGPVAILQRAIASAMVTSISSKILHARSTTPASFRWPAGGRATLIMACQNQFAADARRSFCGSTPVLAPINRAHWQVENVLR